MLQKLKSSAFVTHWRHDWQHCISHWVKFGSLASPIQSLTSSKKMVLLQVKKALVILKRCTKMQIIFIRISNWKSKASHSTIWHITLNSCRGKYPCNHTAAGWPLTVCVLVHGMALYNSNSKDRKINSALEACVSSWYQFDTTHCRSWWGWFTKKS